MILGACANRSTSSLLDSIESYIQERPDSALKVLESLSKNDLDTEKLRAKYSLLYTTALDKNYIDTTDLGVILPASRYYSKHGSPSEKMRANFYHGRIYSNKGEDDSAMNYYQLSLEDSADVSDNHYKALVNSSISDIFSRNHNEEQELKYSKDALRYCRLDKDSVGIWAITGHIASCYANIGRYEEAVLAYQDYLEMPVYDTLAYNRRRIIYAKDLIRKPDPEPELCIEIIEDIAGTMPQAMSIEAYCIYAYSHQLLRNDHIANGILSQLETIDSDIKDNNVFQLWRYKISRLQGNYRQALEDLEHSVLAQDSIVLATLNQSLISSQRDYMSAKAEVLKKENEIQHHRLYLLITLSVFAMALIVFWDFRRKASYNKRIEELSLLHRDARHMLDLQEIETASVKAQLEEKDEALLLLRKQFASIYKAGFKTLNDLCAAYLSPIKKDRKEVLYNEAMHQLDIIISDTESQERFMTLVNDSLDNIIDKLRKDLPSRKEQDFRFLMFIIVGFDATTISNLTGYSVGSVYTKKNRLKNEISALSSPYRDFYLHFIA